ncbi:hypothetical protein K458DRAFT_383454 [Lentithecium fluviatile CBS 122367]|uniref:Uncharacterized protein n=1 Tax=Lentithecium fluviatile CBS 122367 TaxID=1168545 RepID=A0A6G1JIE2_9PLEO|nr:hypothetical protein K458DRAFT_383454 [Lentithecium fluviatile CBS 122367]
MEISFRGIRNAHVNSLHEQDCTSTTHVITALSGALGMLHRSFWTDITLCLSDRYTSYLGHLQYRPHRSPSTKLVMDLLQVQEELNIIIQIMEQQKELLMSREFRDDTRYDGSANAVAMTWVVSFDHIRAHDAVAADLLLFISCIEWKAIPRSILLSTRSEVRMEEAIGMLRGYSFLARRGNEEEYDINRLVHLATRIWARQYNDTRGVAEKGIRHVADIFPLDEYANRTK